MSKVLSQRDYWEHLVHLRTCTSPGLAWRLLMQSGSAGVHVGVHECSYHLLHYQTWLFCRNISFGVCSSIFTSVWKLYFIDKSILLSLTVPDNLGPSVTHSLGCHSLLLRVPHELHAHPQAATSTVTRAGLLCKLVFGWEVRSIQSSENL